MGLYFNWPSETDLAWLSGGHGRIFQPGENLFILFFACYKRKRSFGYREPVHVHHLRHVRIYCSTAIML